MLNERGNPGGSGAEAAYSKLGGSNDDLLVDLELDLSTALLSCS